MVPVRWIRSAHLGVLLRLLRLYLSLALHVRLVACGCGNRDKDKVEETGESAA